MASARVEMLTTSSGEVLYIPPFRDECGHTDGTRPAAARPADGAWPLPTAAHAARWRWASGPGSLGGGSIAPNRHATRWVRRQPLDHPPLTP